MIKSILLVLCFFSIEFLAPAWHPNWIDDLKNEGRSQLLKNKHLFKYKYQDMSTHVNIMAYHRVHVLYLVLYTID